MFRVKVPPFLYEGRAPLVFLSRAFEDTHYRQADKPRKSTDSRRSEESHTAPLTDDHYTLCDSLFQ